MTDRLASQVTAGFLTDRFFRTVVEQLELGAEERGWDEPCMLFEICSAGADTRPEDTLDNIAVVVQGRDLDGHPFDALCGYFSPPECLAVVLSFEGYRHPDGTDLQKNTSKPSANPDRVEQRMMLVLTADGRSGELTRIRDSDEVTWGESSFEEIKEVELDGRIMWALHAVLELPIAGMQYNLLEEVCQEDALSALFDPITASFLKITTRLAQASPEIHALIVGDTELWGSALLETAKAALSGELCDGEDIEALLRMYAASCVAVIEPPQSGDWFDLEQAATICTLSEKSLQIVAGLILDEPSRVALWLGTPVLTMALRGRRKRNRAITELGVDGDPAQEAVACAIVELSERRVELLRAAKVGGS
jgi:hypothetical protein